MPEIRENQHGNKKQVRYLTPPNVLREKVGHGGILPERLEKAEKYLASNKIDFKPYASNILNTINVIMTQARNGDLDDREMIEAVTQQIMVLKAHGAMFKFDLVSEIAGVVLNFLESIPSLNPEAFEIIEAHQHTIQIILTNDIRGDGGSAGEALALELYDACKRYYKKYKIVP